jgi:CheY-like chemotaxis protein
VKPELPLLLAEDQEDDIFLIRRAFEKANVTTPLVVVRDGEEAISYLSGTGSYSYRDAHPLPCLVMTDLKMPRLDGFDLLDWMRKQRALKNIPAIVMSGSGEREDKEKALQLGASDFYVKPSTLEGLIELVREINETWLKPHCHSRQPCATAA